LLLSIGTSLIPGRPLPRAWDGYDANVALRELKKPTQELIYQTFPTGTTAACNSCFEGV